MAAASSDPFGFGRIDEGFNRVEIVKNQTQLLVLAGCIFFASLVGINLVRRSNGFGISETGFFVLVGIAVSLINVSGDFSWSNHETKPFYANQDTFFDGKTFICYFLPPIVFSTGYSIDRQIFDKEIGIIFALAHVGTVVSCLVIGYALYLIAKYTALTDVTVMESLTFGALISATDPVATLSVLQRMDIDSSLYTVRRRNDSFLSIQIAHENVYFFLLSLDNSCVFSS